MSLDQVDHLVVATPDLQQGIDAMAALTGVVAAPGGQHPGRGTRNALLSLGPRRYLEIIAPDPEQPTPSQARWLGVEGATEPRLVTWAAHGAQLSALRARAEREGISLGPVREGTRTRADGVQLAWQLTDPDPLVLDGMVPFFIDWGSSAHPAATAAQGISLQALTIEHPNPTAIANALQALGLDMSVRPAPIAGLVATLQTPAGIVELRSDP